MEQSTVRKNVPGRQQLVTRKRRRRGNLHTEVSFTAATKTFFLPCFLAILMSSAVVVVSAFSSQYGTLPRTKALCSTPGVEVWDGVFSPEVCEDLHELAIDHLERTMGDEEEEEEEEDNENEEDMDGSSIFIHKGPNRSPDDPPLTPIEHALDSFLNAYNEKEDNNNNKAREVVVEYWCRQEHLNLEAHADVDETSFERSLQEIQAGKAPEFRYPDIVHILYLTKPTMGLGPTCVFPATTKANKDLDGSIRNEIGSVVTVPAVSGRVLRLPGNVLHAVPKPLDVWFSNADEEDDDDEEEEEEEEYSEEEWEDDDDDERSVILFNTWEIGPIGVPFDPMFQVESDEAITNRVVSAIPPGVDVDDNFVEGMVEFVRQSKNEKLNEWREKYSNGKDQQPVVYSGVHCQPRDSWKSTSVDTSSTDTIDKRTICVPLMGDKVRRRYPKKKICWSVPSSFEKAVNEPERPCEFPLTD